MVKNQKNAFSFILQICITTWKVGILFWVFVKQKFQYWHCMQWTNHYFSQWPNFPTCSIGNVSGTFDIAIHLIYFVLALTHIFNRFNSSEFFNKSLKRLRNLATMRYVVWVFMLCAISLKSHKITQKYTPNYSSTKISERSMILSMDTMISVMKISKFLINFQIKSKSSEQIIFSFPETIKKSFGLKSKKKNSVNYSKKTKRIHQQNKVFKYYIFYSSGYILHVDFRRKEPIWNRTLNYWYVLKYLSFYSHKIQYTKSKKFNIEQFFIYQTKSRCDRLDFG